jgi:hypothetical protein
LGISGSRAGVKTIIIIIVTAQAQKGRNGRINYDSTPTRWIASQGGHEWAGRQSQPAQFRVKWH